MIVLLTGMNSFARREAYVALRAAHNRDGSLDTNTLILDGATVTPAELRVAATTVPFLAEYRLVRVDGLGKRMAGGGRRRRDLGEWADLPRWLEAIPPSTVLVFMDDDLTEAHPLRAALAAVGEFRTFPALSRRDAGGWLRDRARAVGVRLTPSAERRLLGRVGVDPWALAGELEKLRLYAGDVAVDDADVDMLSPLNREATIFQLVDAVAEGRSAGAMQALDVLRAGSEAPQQVLAMIARQFRMIVVAREILDKGGTITTVQERLRVPPFLARRVVEQAQRYSQCIADATLDRILACEVAIQTYRRGLPGGMRHDLALELLVVELAGVRVAS